MFIKRMQIFVKTFFLKLKKIFSPLYVGIVYFLYSNISNNVINQKTAEPLSKKEFYLYMTPNWYHNFSLLGLKTHQYSDIGYKLHQKIKEKVIFEYIEKAINLCKNSNPKQEASVIELFCADGYFANYSLINGADKVVGIDLEEESGEGVWRNSVLDQARLATKLLGNENKINFYKQDVFCLDENFNIGICVGGLYHIEEPKKLLEILNKKIKKYLIVQTVVSLDNEDKDYFESPAPGWTWGCRFSHEYLLEILKLSGWTVLEQDRNELIENTMSCDRGSSYCLCVNDNQLDK